MNKFAKTFVLLVLLYGTIGLERMVVAFVLPGIQKDFGLNYAEATSVIGIFAFTWAIGNWAMGSLSDYVGRKPVIVVLALLGGILSWLGGLAGTLAVLLAIRGVMGFAEGGVWSPLAATVGEESSPLTRARNLGIAPAAFILFGAALGPILSTMLMETYGWRHVFFIYAIPALILGILIWLVMKEPPSTQATLAARRSGAPRQKRLDGEGKEIRYGDVFKNRNILIMMVSWTFNTCFLWLFTTFGMLYMTKVHQLPFTTVGLMMSCYGVGACLGMFVFGIMGDYFGRTKGIFFSQVICGLFAIVFVNLSPGIGLPVLALVILVTGMCGAGGCPVIVSLTAETVGFALAATAIGTVSGVGELLGGGILPVVGGGIADKIGLSATLYLAAGLSIVSGIVGLFARETAPRIVARRQKGLEVSVG
jgi:MFS family permease